MKLLLMLLFSFGLLAQEYETPLVEPLYSSVSFNSDGCMENVLIAFRNNTKKQLKEVTFLFSITNPFEGEVYIDKVTLKLKMEIGKPAITLFKMKKESCITDPYGVRSAEIISYE